MSSIINYDHIFWMVSLIYISCSWDCDHFPFYKRCHAAAAGVQHSVQLHFVFRSMSPLFLPSFMRTRCDHVFGFTRDAWRKTVAWNPVTAEGFHNPERDIQTVKDDILILRTRYMFGPTVRFLGCISSWGWLCLKFLKTLKKYDQFNRNITWSKSLHSCRITVWMLFGEDQQSETIHGSRAFLWKSWFHHFIYTLEQI